MDSPAIQSLLDQTGERCFVCGSVRFAMIPEIRDGVFCCVFYFQNHCARDATLTLLIDVISADGVQFQTVIRCPANVAGVLRVPWSVPDDCITESQRCLIYGDVHYALPETFASIQQLPPPEGIPVQPLRANTA